MAFIQPIESLQFHRGTVWKGLSKRCLRQESKKNVLCLLLSLTMSLKSKLGIEIKSLSVQTSSSMIEPLVSAEMYNSVGICHLQGSARVLPSTRTLSSKSSSPYSLWCARDDRWYNEPVVLNKPFEWRVRCLVESDWVRERMSSVDVVGAARTGEWTLGLVAHEAEAHRCRLSLADVGELSSNCNCCCCWLSKLCSDGETKKVAGW